MGQRGRVLSQRASSSKPNLAKEGGLEPWADAVKWAAEAKWIFGRGIQGVSVGLRPKLNNTIEATLYRVTTKRFNTGNGEILPCVSAAFPEAGFLKKQLSDK